MVDLSKLSNVVKFDVVKKDVYNNLVAKVDNIDTRGFVLKTKYHTDKSELENKIPNTNGLVKKTEYDSKTSEIEVKVLDDGTLVIQFALSTVENNIPSINNLVKKVDYDTKVTEIQNKLNKHNHDKYITTPEFNTLAADVFNSRLALANLVTQRNFGISISLIIKLLKIKQKMSLLKMNEKS